ncbi:MAG TPA: type II toxin-antitoxin system RelE/ParE family toxin [Chloroflexota bacterium]|nr:type II toxin-antitoxin system RelE/ParE family toxin [Chloroflexota bacterium]
MALRWSDSAIADLKRIQGYIARDSPKEAQRVVGTVFRAAEGLVTLPFVGHAGPDVEGERERPLSQGGYVLLYRVIADHRSRGGKAEVEIVRVLGPGWQRG